MPGPTKWRGAALEHAIKSNKVKSYVLDERVRAILRTVNLAAKSGIPENAKEQELNRPEDAEFLRRVAAESIVLLKNEKSALPFDKSKTVAVIGPNAKAEVFSGGGSASLLPYYCVTPFQGVSKQCQDVQYSQGCYNHKALPLIGPHLRDSEGKVGFSFRAYDKPPSDPNRKILDVLHLTDSNIYVADYEVPNYDSTTYYCDCEGFFTPNEDGRHDFGVIVQGTGQLLINDELLVDNTHDQEPGDAFFGAGTKERVASIDLIKGKTYKVSINFGTAPTAPPMDRAVVSFGPGGIRIGMCKQIDPIQAIADAAALAASVDQVVVFAGLNGDWESEGYDRPHMDLPPYSDDLITKIIEANPNAVVCIQSGTPVAMPWIDGAGTVVQAWYGGNETGNAIADVLFGSVNPVSAWVHAPNRVRRLTCLTLVWQAFPIDSPPC